MHQQWPRKTGWTSGSKMHLRPAVIREPVRYTGGMAYPRNWRETTATYTSTISNGPTVIYRMTVTRTYGTLDSTGDAA
jgi:hypothetical protein